MAIRLPKIDPTKWALEFTTRTGNFNRRYFESRSRLKKFVNDHRPHRIDYVRPPAGYVKPEVRNSK